MYKRGQAGTPAQIVMGVADQRSRAILIDADKVSAVIDIACIIAVAMRHPGEPASRVILQAGGITAARVTHHPPQRVHRPSHWLCALHRAQQGDVAGVAVEARITAQAMW